MEPPRQIYKDLRKVSWGGLVHLGGVLDRLGGVFGRLGDLFGPSWGVLGASWERHGVSWAGLEGLRGVLGGVLGRSSEKNEKRKIVKNHWFYSVSEFTGHTKSVCEAVNVA